MNLKDFLNNRDKPPELYWSLVIEKGWVQAGIWYIGENAAEVLNISPPAAWVEEDELIGACDAALSSSIAKLPENYQEPNKTVFGVASSWVKGGEIQEEYLAKIKKVCTDLSLTPVGFVVLPEAIAHLYKSEEGTPLSAVIVGLGTDELEVTVFKLGNLVGTTAVARSVSLTEDVTEGLSRFEGAAPLPSRFIVYDGKGGELEEAKEELLKNSWEGEEKIKFLHTPKAEILTSDRKVLATSLAGANEIGNVTQVSSQTEDKAQEEDLPPKEEIVNVTEPLEETTAEDLGFAVGEDITQTLPEPSPPPPVQPRPVMPPRFTNPQAVQEHIPHKESYLQKTKTLFHGFSSKIKIQGPKISGQKNRNPFIYILVLVLILIVGIGIYWWFAPKATLTIFVSPKTYQEQISLTFSTSGQFDEAKSIIPGKAISSESGGDKTKSTTGTKLVGEKAGGSVEIVNGNGNSIHLANGTVLTSSGGLKFFTTSEASVSGQLIPGSPGKATLSVTAADIGAQYNLAKGEIFKVGVFDKSQVAASSQEDFSGGSSQQIAAVSADDQKKLEEELKAELSAQAKEDITSKVDENQIFVNDLSDLSVTSETFDHKVGDVADTLKLNLSVTATGVAADKEKLLQFATNSLKSKIPQGYALRSSQIGFKFTFAGKSGNDLTYNAIIAANFLPTVNVDELKKQVSGKTTQVVEDYLKSVPGYTRAEVSLKPHLPGPLGTLPRIKSNIIIEVAAEE